MRQARAFLVVCAGIFLLALAYHLGAQSAGAQVGSTVMGVSADGWGGIFVMTQNGDCYWRPRNNGPTSPLGSLVSVGNFWSGATPAQSMSIGQLKAKYATPAKGTK